MRAILLTPKKDYGEVSSSRAVDPVEGCHCLCYEGPTILVTVHDTMVRYPDTSGLREKGLIWAHSFEATVLYGGDTAAGA